MLPLKARFTFRAPIYNCRPRPRWQRYISYQHKSADPLRILFCGSDEFSIEALEALHREHVQDREFIESIEVVARKGKRSGRNMTAIREVPIVDTAQQLSLPIHQIPTFTGWEPPTRQKASFNLIIAVSFGLLVPPRILSPLKYGGLNLHPSNLPELRGPAPLHHAILQGKEQTGITLQTLHPRQFDGGLVLAQEPFAIPRPQACTFLELKKAISPVAADFLVREMRKLVFVDPIAVNSQFKESHAPKLEPDDARVDWSTWTAEQMTRMSRVMSSVWCYTEMPARSGPEKRRIKLHGLRLYDGPLVGCNKDLSAGQIGAVEGDSNNPWMPIFKTADGECVVATAITVEGRPSNRPPGSALTKTYHEGLFLR